MNVITINNKQTLYFFSQVSKLAINSPHLWLQPLFRFKQSNISIISTWQVLFAVAAVKKLNKFKLISKYLKQNHKHFKYY